MVQLMITAESDSVVLIPAHPQMNNSLDIFIVQEIENRL
jgi:hypothetical protein